MTDAADRASRFGALRLRRARTTAHRPALRGVALALGLAVLLAAMHGALALGIMVGIALVALGLARLAIRWAAWARISRLVLALDLVAATAAIEVLGRGHPELALAPLVAVPLVSVYRDAKLVAATTALTIGIVLATSGDRPVEGVLRALALAAEGYVLCRLAARSAQRIEREAASAARERRGLVVALGVAREELATSQRAAAERDLAQERERLAMAARAAFLNHLSHELRTPLNAVVGYLDLLGTSFLDPEQEGHLAGARTSAQHLLELVHDVLDHAKIEAGKLELAEQPFEVIEVVRNVTCLVENAASAKRLSIEVELDPATPPWLRGDALRVRQVLLNLLTNAIKFTEHGRVRVAVRPREGDLGVRFDVSDTGMGIAASAHERVFDPYRQADAAIVQRHGGTGLGLSISRRLARAMGGDLTFHSTVGIGTTFHFDAPLPVAERPRQERILSAELDSESAPVLRVLIADDSATNRLVTTRMLEALGHDVVCAENGLQAVARCLASSFDLVVMDVEMPELDGLGATRKLRSVGLTVPILGFTAHESAQQDAACRDAGMNGVLHKPLELVQLRSALASATAHARPPRASAPLPAGRPISGWVDRAAVRAKLSAEPQLEGQLLRSVVSEADRLAAELRSVMDRRDTSGIRRAAHALGVCLESVGTEEVMAALARLEDAAAAGNADLAIALAIPVLQAMADARKDLDPGSGPNRRAA